MNKALCEMSSEELKIEYDYCVEASHNETLSPIDRRYFYDRSYAILQLLEDFKCTE